MKSNYKKLGCYIAPKGELNKDLITTKLLGINNAKYFVKAKTNLNGIDLSKYRIVENNQFAFNRATTRNGDKISIALRESGTCIVSPSYRMFEVKDENELDSQYLMMWFRRPEFDRYARFKSHGSAHEFFDYQEMEDIELPIPSIEKQREIVREYNVVNDRIALNKQFLEKLEDTSQAAYKEWFVDFEFPISKKIADSIGNPELEGRPYQSSGGKMEYCKELEKDIPSFWGVELLENISDMKYGKMLSADKFSKIGYPVFSGYGLRGFYKEYMYENPEILIICRGVSGTGKVVLSPPKSYITNLSIVTPITNNSFQKGFVYYYLKNNNLRALDSGSAQSMITIGDLNKVPILFPDEGTQVLFNIIFEKLTNARRNVEAENNHLEELKVLLLARMFDLG